MSDDDTALRFGLRQLLAIPVIYAITIPLWHISLQHFIAGMVAATALSGVILLSCRRTHSRTSRQFVFGLLGGIVGASLSPLAFDIAQGDLKFYRAIGLTFVVSGTVVGFSLATLLSRQSRKRYNDMHSNDR